MARGSSYCLASSRQRARILALLASTLSMNLRKASLALVASSLLMGGAEHNLGSVVDSHLIPPTSLAAWTAGAWLASMRFL